jgi:hypothetical protein
VADRGPEGPPPDFPAGSYHKIVSICRLPSTILAVSSLYWKAAAMSTAGKNKKFRF